MKKSLNNNGLVVRKSNNTTIVVSDNQLEEIANMIVSNADCSFVEYQIDKEITLCVNYSIEVDGEVEDDYFNGTGSFDVTSVSCTIDSIDVYDAADEDGTREYNIEIQDRKLEHLVETAIAA